MNSKSKIGKWETILFSLIFFSSFVFSNYFVDSYIYPKQFFIFITTGLFLLGILVASLFNNSSDIKLSIFDCFIIIFLLWNVFSFFRSIEEHMDNANIFTLICSLAIYFTLNFLFNKNINKQKFISDIVTILLIVGVIQSVWGILQYFDFIPDSQKQFKIVGAFGNPSQYSNFLVPIFGYAFCRLLFSAQMKILSLIACILIIIVIILCFERTAWVASLFIIVYLCNKRFNIWKSIFGYTRFYYVKFFLLLICVILFLFSTHLLFNLKKESASGRLFIWQVSLSIIKDNPLFGCGFDKYPSLHNVYQAEYFKNHPDDMKNKYLAGEVNYAFNEFVQFTCETGLVGGLLIFGLFVLPFYWKERKEFTQINSELIGAKASLISFLVCCMFSYPLHSSPTLVLFFFTLAVININIEIPTLIFVKKHYLRIVFVLLFILSTIIFLLFQLERVKAEYRWLNAYKTMRNNKFEEAYKQYKELFPYLHTNQYFLYNFGSELSLMGRYKESIKVLKKANYSIDDSSINTTLGFDYENLGDLIKAEEYYKKAMFIFPAKLTPRYKLANIYLITNRKEEAVQMAKIILNMKVKIESAITINIKEEMLNLVKENEKETISD